MQPPNQDEEQLQSLLAQGKGQEGIRRLRKRVLDVVRGEVRLLYYGVFEYDERIYVNIPEVNSFDILLHPTATARQDLRSISNGN